MWMGISDAVLHWSKYTPSKTSMLISGQHITYFDLMTQASSISYTLVKNSVTKKRVGICLDNKFLYISSVIAIHQAGCSCVTLNPICPDSSLKVNIADTDLDTIICSATDAKRIRCVSKEIKTVIEIENIDSVSDIFNSNVDRDLEEWGVLFSSGSTGASKAIKYNHLSMTSELIAWCLELGIRRENSFYIGLPAFYTGGLVLTLATLLVGGTVVMPSHNKDRNHPAIWQDYQEVLKQHSLDFAFFIPDQLRSFLKIAQDPIHGGLTVLVMGSYISGEEKVNIAKTLKSNVIESWGNTEGLGTITHKEDLYVRPDSIGRPFLTENICIIDNDISECKPHDVGMLAGDDDTMFDEYINREEATIKTKQNNLIVSDDMGYMDDKNYFYILGRAQESYIVNSKTVFLPEIEAEIRSSSKIDDVCIVTDGNDEETIFSCLIVLASGQNDSTLIDLSNAKFSVKIDTFIAVNEIPTLPSGKRDRVTAREIFSRLRKQ